MANLLKMADVTAIQVLLAQGKSRREIARILGIHRETVGRYAALWKAENQAPPIQAVENRPNPPLGSDPSHPPNLSAEFTVQNQPNPPAGSDASHPPNLPAGSAVQNRPNPPIGSSGPRSRCEPYLDIIGSCLERGLSAQRIWQDLRTEQGFAGGYDGVKRFVRRLRTANPLPYRRMECEPGAEAQVDFGTGAPVVIPEGQPLPLGVHSRRRKPHVFRMVLSHSRKGYSEVVWRQSTDDFIRCLENAFWFFGGVPRTLVVDNLKAAVIKADWFDPDLNPKVRDFCQHYGTVILPTKPRMPRHKGKIEGGVKYVQSNALKDKTFESLAGENRHLLEWEQTVADTRIHGTTHKQVKKCFEEIERPALLPLPENRFPVFQEGRRIVNRDGHVEVAKAYYSVPPEHLGCTVWVRWESRLVHIFDDRMRPITKHVRVEPGLFSTDSRHLADRKISGVERGTAWMLSKVGRVGPKSVRWAETMLARRGIEGVRVLQGLMSLTYHHPADSVEKACEIAHSHGAYRLRDVRTLIGRQAASQTQFEFAEEHPIIRSLSEYGEWVHSAFLRGQP